MPTIDENLQAWNRDWPGQGGDEWSRVWGGPSAQWFGTILPRLKSYVPAATILEIAPGYGRWTQFLRPLADRLVLVDLSATCIDVCRRRFTGCSMCEAHGLACVTPLEGWRFCRQVATMQRIRCEEWSLRHRCAGS